MTMGTKIYTTPVVANDERYIATKEFLFAIAAQAR